MPSYKPEFLHFMHHHVMDAANTRRIIRALDRDEHELRTRHRTALDSYRARSSSLAIVRRASMSKVQIETGEEMVGAALDALWTTQQQLREFEGLFNGA
jgi:2-hydroxychromene-2-carboxylate isomerase